MAVHHTGHYQDRVPTRAGPRKHPMFVVGSPGGHAWRGLCRRFVRDAVGVAVYPHSAGMHVRSRAQPLLYGRGRSQIDGRCVGSVMLCQVDRGISQIRALETELHAQLLVRDSSGTQLTEAGGQLFADAVRLLAGAEAVQRRVARAASKTATFTVGFMPGLTVTEPIRALGAAHPDLTVDVLRTDWTNQVTVLHDGRAALDMVGCRLI